MSTPGPAGVRLVTAYKLGKASLEALIALALAVAAASLERDLAALAAALRAHLPSGVGVVLLHASDALQAGPHPALVAALGADAALSAFEGWTLRRGRSWAPRLVIAVTALPLPFEAVELVRRPGAGRVLLLSVNLAVVAYLAWREGARAAAPG